MDIDKLTVGEIKEIASIAAGFAGGAKCAPSGNPYKHLMGEPVFIRSVTHHYTGRLVAVHEHELVIEEAAWIASDGRFHQALTDGELDEVEPYPPGPVVIGRGAMLDCCAWVHALPMSQK